MIVRTTTWSAGPGCHGGCGVLAHVEDGKLVKIEGDPDHPMNRGRLCSRCLAMTQYVDHPERLRSPRIRVGERGENKWRDISWDEAFDYIEEKMGKIREEHGPESMIFSMGTGRDVGAWICLLAYNYGSPNVMFALSGIGCYTPRIAASETVLGDYCVFDGGQWLPQGHDDPGYQVPETIVIWGYNINASCPDNIFGHWLTDLMKKGSKVICIDPRLSFFASRADKWLQLRPGTDGALAMGFLNVIINEGLYDKAFVEKWTNSPHLVRSDTGALLRAADLVAGGSPDDFVVWDTVSGAPAIWDSANQAFTTPGVVPALEVPADQCAVRLLDESSVPVRTVWSTFCAEVAKYPLDKVAEITWLKAEDIAEAARLYAKSKPATIHWGVAIDMTPNITPTAMAIADLWCITGNLDVPGGNVIARMAYNAVAYALPGSKGVIGLPSMDADTAPHRPGQVRRPAGVHLARADRCDHRPDLHRRPLPHQGHVDTGLQPHRRHSLRPQALGQGTQEARLRRGGRHLHDPHGRAGRHSATSGHLLGEGGHPQLVDAPADHQQGHRGTGAASPTTRSTSSWPSASTPTCVGETCASSWTRSWSLRG